MKAIIIYHAELTISVVDIPREYSETITSAGSFVENLPIYDEDTDTYVLCEENEISLARMKLIYDKDGKVTDYETESETTIKL